MLDELKSKLGFGGGAVRGRSNDRYDDYDDDDDENEDRDSSNGRRSGR